MQADNVYSSEEDLGLRDLFPIIYGRIAEVSKEVLYLGLEDVMPLIEKYQDCFSISPEIEEEKARKWDGLFRIVWERSKRKVEGLGEELDSFD